MNLFSFPGKLIYTLLLLLFFFSSSGQRNVTKIFSKELSFASDNDFYLLQGKDGYYTNGFMLNYSKIHHSKRKTFLKQVDEFILGQKMYTAYSRKIHTADQIDRPITGYLYLQFLRSDFFKQNQMFHWGVSAGTIGKASLGEALQNSYHKLIDINTSEWGWVWDYQLKSAFGVDLHAKYARSLLPESGSFIQITPITQATLGTFFTNASESILLQLGKFNPESESAYWNAAIGKKEDQGYHPEIFFYYNPQLTWQLYNATVQGGLFRKDKGPIVSDPEPFVLLHQLGAMYSFNRYSLRLAVNFKSKEATSQRFNHKYGTFVVNYRFD